MGESKRIELGPDSSITASVFIEGTQVGLDPHDCVDTFMGRALLSQEGVEYDDIAYSIPANHFKCLLRHFPDLRPSSVIRDIY